VTCPADCLERHSTNWRAILLALSGAGFAISLIAGLYLYASATYAKASDLEAQKQELKEVRGELRGDIKSLSDKMDLLLQRTKP
jgi:hypothetical protein